MNAKCIHRYLIDDDGTLPLGHHGKEVYRDGDFAYTLCDCGSNASDHDPIVKALSSVYLKEEQEEPEKYEFVPCLPDMIHDFIRNMQDEEIGFETLADLVSQEINDILSWDEYIGFQGGGRVFLPIPENFLK